MRKDKLEKIIALLETISRARAMSTTEKAEAELASTLQAHAILRQDQSVQDFLYDPAGREARMVVRHELQRAGSKVPRILDPQYFQANVKKRWPQKPKSRQQGKRKK